MTSTPSATGGTGSSARLAIDGTALYWLDRDRGVLMRQSRTDGVASVVTPADVYTYPFVALNSTHAFWIETSPGITIRRAPIGGGMATLAAMGNNGPVGFVADAEHLFFARMENREPVVVDHTLASANERVVGRGAALGLAMTASDLYGTSCGRDGVWRMPRAGGSRVTLVADSSCAITIAIDDGWVYFSDTRSDAGTSESLVLRVPRSGGASEVVMRVDGIAFAVRNGFVYGVRGGAPVRVPAAGGEPTVLSAADGAVGIAADDSHVFWIAPSPSGGLVLRSTRLPP